MDIILLPILIPILIPIVAAVLILFAPKRIRFFKETVSLAATAAVVFAAVKLFNKNIFYSVPWAGFGFDFSLRCYHFSSFIVLAAAFFAFLIALYSCAFVSNKNYAKQYYIYFLASLSFVNGAVLSDNLVAMLFFWEGLSIATFGLIAIGNTGAFKTATKAFIIGAASDLCMMIGIALSAHLSGTLAMSNINLSLTGLGGLAFVLLMIGAISRAGSMPFHSWIPDAAVDAPLPFMAILPASLEKLLGIYLLTRISLDMFKTNPHSWASYVLMIIGSVTIILAVMMALIQKDYKKLLSYHAISQVGYMILGIGTFVPAGIIGGLFHMINNAIYKSCLFLTGGSVEKQAGTTDLGKLGNLAFKMPVTFACFIIAALSISGVPPFNGFFSKELIYDGALERGRIFYIAAIVGSFLTAASFLKLGHAAYLGKKNNTVVKEAPPAMLIPAIVMALVCILFGIWNILPIKYLIQPILGEHALEGHNFYGFPTNAMLIIVTVIVLIAAVLNHLYGVMRTGSGLKAVDHIHYAPVLSWIYDKAEKGYFDPYNIGLKIVGAFSGIAWVIDRVIDRLYNDFIPFISNGLTLTIRKLHDGNYDRYIVWSLAGMVLVALFFMK